MQAVGVAFALHEINVHGHEHQCMVSAVTEIHLAQPVTDLHLLQTRFFADFSLGSALRLFAFLYVTLRNSPAIFGVFYEQDLEIVRLLVAAEYYSTGSSLVYHLLDSRATR